MSLVQNPYDAIGSGDIARYEDYRYSWDPRKVGAQSMVPQSFDLMRQRAMGTIGSGVESGQRTAMSQLASSGGLSAADRQALMAQGNRQRVNLYQGAMAPYDQMEAQNVYDTNKFNIGQQQSAADYNQQIMNQRARDIATMGEQKATNMYEQRLKEAMLERQLDAARAIARQQGA